MSKHLEIEVKYLLSKGDYETLQNWMRNMGAKEFSQTNFYIDTEENHLEKWNIGMRIRKCEEYELTIKINQKEGKLEINQILSEEEVQSFLQSGKIPSGEVKSHLKEYGIDEKKYIIFAELNNKRIELPFQEGILDLDCSTYFGQTDYEIEYESSSLKQGQWVLNLLFKRFKILSAKPSFYTKLARAKNAKKIIDNL